jgi:GNAT superfamily N-acetyltransferase
MKNVSSANIRLQYVDPGSVDAQRCLFAYASELAGRFPEGYEASALVSPDEIRAHGACLVAHVGDCSVGCGILRQLEGKIDEIKHLWVDSDLRGVGVASMLLEELERAALQRGNIKIRLDTHEVLTEAISLYRRFGYVEIHPYGSNPYAGCGSKRA